MDSSSPWLQLAELCSNYKTLTHTHRTVTALYQHYCAEKGWKTSDFVHFDLLGGVSVDERLKEIDRMNGEKVKKQKRDESFKKKKTAKMAAKETKRTYRDLYLAAGEPTMSCCFVEEISTSLLSPSRAHKLHQQSGNDVSSASLQSTNHCTKTLVDLAAREIISVTGHRSESSPPPQTTTRGIFLLLAQHNVNTPVQIKQRGAPTWLNPTPTTPQLNGDIQTNVTYHSNVLGTVSVCCLIIILLNVAAELQCFGGGMIICYE